MTIKEVSLKYNLSQDTLRYYERIGLIPPVPRSAGGNRDYDEESCNWVEFIKCMRASGLPIEALIEYVHLYQQGDSTLDARLQLLKEQYELLNERIAEMLATQRRLEGKIAHYAELCAVDIHSCEGLSDCANSMK